MMKLLASFLSLYLLMCLATLAQVEEPVRYVVTEPAATTLTVFGTLTLPDKLDQPVPVGLIIAGSGPTDRNGNNPIPAGQPNSVKANAYKLLADSLAKLGIATLRYDKRGIGESITLGMTERSISFDTYIDDAVGWINQLKNDKRFNKIAVLGHSEGSLIGMVAARKAKADAYVSLAGPGENIAATLKRQLASQLPETDREAVFKALDSLKAGFTLGTLPTKYPAIHQLFRPSVQPYMIAWMRYDPVEQIKQLTIPVLIVQGKRDVQVKETDAENLKTALPTAEIRFFDEMNHLFKNVATSSLQEALTSYADSNQPLTAGFATALAQFIKTVR